MRFFRQDVDGERGASMVEYGLLVAVIALMALSAITLLGDSTEETFTTIAAELEGTHPADDGTNSESNSDDQSDDSSDQSGNSDGQNQDDSSQDDSSQDDSNQGDSNDDDANGGSDDDSHDQQGGDDDVDNGDDAGNNGDDDDNGDDAGNNAGNDDNGDDAGNNGGASGGDDSDEQEEEEDANEPQPTASSTESKFYWWNSTKHGGNGAWTASVSYGNDTNRHQYLDLEIARIDERGNESVSTYNNFYVPAGGITTYTHWNNELEDKNGKLDGTVEVKFRVVKVRTSDQSWQSYSYEVDGDWVRVAAPSTR